MLRITARTVVPTAATVGVVLLAGCGTIGDDGGTTTTSADARASAVDRAFVTQMIPHHEAALVMAADTDGRAEHGQIRALARNITRTQEREILQMRSAVDALGIATDPASGGGGSMSGMHHGGGGSSMAAAAKTLGLPEDAMGMSMDMTALKTARPFDRAFIDEMIPHHQGAIRMARAELARGRDPQLRRIATGIVTAQKREITEMNAWRVRWYGGPSPAGGVPKA